jgi:hypothetical protein
MLPSIALAAAPLFVPAWLSKLWMPSWPKGIGTPFPSRILNSRTDA